VSFAKDVMPIFESRCINCHGGESTKEGLDLKTFAALMAGSRNGSVVTPGNANDSYLVEQLLNGKMPKRGPKLTPDQIQVIVNWVNSGAPNN
jgi:mono/diheme cytochrome c family protein